SPQTYACNLCAITYSAFGMRRPWKEFLDRLDVGKEFLHADELIERYGRQSVELPAIFKREGDQIEAWIDAESIAACRDLDDLKKLIADKLHATNGGSFRTEREVRRRR
ncbi:MAG TPA: hypothetical protein VJQ56_07250, partial [Blastocatellia bacterium]|nr:hypothetical protein [Blastocatellia bacterium]